MAQFLGAEMPKVFKNITFHINWIYIALIFVIVIIIGIVIFLVYDKRTYRRKIIVFENISGQGFQITHRDKARVVRLGDGGEELLYLKKKKVYRTGYGRKMGQNTYWFAIGQDGYWYNIVLGDLDTKLGMLDIEPIDRDMRYMHVAIRKNITERYRKQHFMEKYGTIMLSGIFILIMIIGLGILINKMTQTAGAVNTAVTTANQVMQTADRIMNRVEVVNKNVDNAQSGLIPATT